MPSINLLQIDRYPTYQVFLVAVAALGATVILFPLWIRLVRYRNIGQQVRADGPQGHLVKQGTPTMGGVLIMFVITGVFLAMGRTDRPSMLVLAAMLACAVLGFVDDYAKVVKERSLGLTALSKIVWQVLVSLSIGLLAVNWAGMVPKVALPLTGLSLDLGVFSSSFAVGGFQIVVPWLYLALLSVMVVGFSNTVNLTDGLDGLAIGSVLIAFGTYTVFTYLAGNARLAKYLLIPPVAGAGEVTVFCAAMVGASLAFLWFNCHPAQLFMGDVGSLSLGAAIACTAVNLRYSARGC